MAQCIGRISKAQGVRHFADGRHRFYLECRCSNIVIVNTNKCTRCIGRSRDKMQSSGKYDHGNVNEPIPDHSHMYGGKWYTDMCDKWGKPSDADIKVAEEHRNVARAEFAIISPPAISIERKKSRKRIIYPEDPVTAPASAPIPAPAPAPIPVSAPAIQPRKRTIKPKPKNEIIMPVESKSIIATHIEKDIEEFCIDDYEIEYVKLTPFEHNDISYFREPIKNKLFERKSKMIGAYIGRYDSYTDTIRTDIPDSDSED